MNYRSPVVSMQRELEGLEEKLAGLRALPAAQPRPKAPLSKRARLERDRETRSLARQLAKVEKKVAAREMLVGVRALTPREATSSLRMRRTALACLAVGGLIFSLHLGLAAHVRLVWTQATCSILVDDDVHVASYDVGGKTYRFHPRVGDDPPASMRCFVPSPPRDGVGRIDPAPTATVGLVDKLSFGWLLAGALSVLMGAFVFYGEYADRRKRQRCEIEPDDFGSSD